ncbi:MULTISPECIES: hypothetical protein [Cysteiniphilum]|uniref:Uncharacterized protein n=1 Tax=Cysteiniphilum litorale TaxID=2056700 RepID=A0A8J3EAJ8_9GAMM|nr:MULTISPECIES: hypothetical protein [Cysteiniphilum]GGG08922.1 hypothetical protein GCM10010995_28140 [Cysteiniphilum litorale]
MPMIEKPKSPTYTTLPKKIKVTEDTYLKAIEYLDWNKSLDGEKDLDFLIDQALQVVFDGDREFKKYLKENKNSNNAKSIEKTS